MKKIKLLIITVLLFSTAFITGVKAGTINLANYTIPFAQPTRVTKSKTTNTGKTSCTAKLVTGSPRQIIVWTYASDSSSLYCPVVIATENGGTATQNYYSGKPSSTGTRILILFRDYQGGISSGYQTSGNINYY